MTIEYPSEAQLPELKTLWKLCFPDTDDFISGFFATGFSREKCRVLRDGEEVATALYWLDGEYRGQKLAYLYAVATHPDHRGRGLCRRLMDDTHGLLRDRGYAAALLLPGEPGLRSMYQKMGYRDCCGQLVRSCIAGDAIPVTQITWQEYAALRPAFLPEDGAVQDGLAFLATYARFYRGEDFLLAAAHNEETFFAMELLGNGQAAPGILAALRAPKGTFRTPGGQSGVMSLPLASRVQLPGYFGLTFD